MIKFAKSIISLMITIIFLFGLISINGDYLNNSLYVFADKAGASNITSYSTGDIIEFGWYPQSIETNSIVISTLNELAGDNNDWTSYYYYSGSGDWGFGDMSSSNFMRYIDVSYDGQKYRGVVFDQYRPINTGGLLTTECQVGDENYQYDNGYRIDTVYWFKYEPIRWKVIDPAKGLILSEEIIDSQAFNNYVLASGTDEYTHYICWGDNEKTYYANNYANSSIRQWLNNDFYNTAFSISQQDSVQLTVLDDTSSQSEYSSKITVDKIFLPSYSDVMNGKYGFNTDVGISPLRRAQGSDYAKCQGLYVTDNSFSGNSKWYLRTPGSSCGSIIFVDIAGQVDGDFYTSMSTCCGVRVALNLCVTTDFFQSSVNETGKGTRSGCSNANIKIINNKNIVVDYKSKIILHSECNSDEYNYVWYNADNHSIIAEGNTYSEDSITNTIKVYVVAVDAEGTIVAKSETEIITVKIRLIDRLVAFFRALFGTLPVWVDNKIINYK